MRDIDEMDMPGYIKILAYKSRKEHEPKKVSIDSLAMFGGSASTGICTG